MFILTSAMLVWQCTALGGTGSVTRKSYVVTQIPSFILVMSISVKLFAKSQSQCSDANQISHFISFT